MCVRPGITRFLVVAVLAGLPWSPVQAAETEKLDERIHNLAIVGVMAKRVGVDPALAMAIALAESGGRSNVTSSKGAVGVMQIMPEYAGRDVGVWNRGYLQDPYISAYVGLRHLARLHSLFLGNRTLVIAAYNAGEGTVIRWLGRYGDPRNVDVNTNIWIEMIPFLETGSYVKVVLGNQRTLRNCNQALTLNACLQKFLVVQ